MARKINQKELDEAIELYKESTTNIFEFTYFQSNEFNIMIVYAGLTVVFKNDLVYLYYKIMKGRVSTYDIFNKDTELPEVKDLEQIQKIVKLTR